MKEIKTKGKFRKSKVYGLIGCLALFSIITINPVLNVKAEEFNRTDSGQVDNSNTGVNKLIPSEEIKSVPNGERNFYSTVVFTTESGLGSGTLISPDTIVTVAHNFVHLNEKTNPISVENNVNKNGDIHIATLPNGKQVKFSNNDVHFWNREGFVNGYKNDLAVIKLKKSFDSQPAELTDSVKKLSNGDKIHVFGFPKGKLQPILNGTVENVENYGANIMGVAYQGSAPGMSGGGLYDSDGKLIGVNQNGVEGLRSGGITFSKEQLDWVKSIVKGENTKPVYLTENKNKDEKDENHQPEKDLPKPKVEYIGRGKNIVRKTTTYTVDSETGVISENIKEEVNPEVDMHFYFVYSVIDENDNKLDNEYSYYKGIILKEEEYIPEGGKWLANYTLHGNSDKGIDGVLKWPDDTYRFEYNGEIYKVVGSSKEHIISGPDSNDDERSNYEKDSKIWHTGKNLRLYYGGSTSPDAPQSIKDYVALNELGLAKDGKVGKAFLYVEPVRGSYTQTFIDEDQAKAHENEENYNPENYSIKETYFSGLHKLTDDFILPKAPEYIQKDNKIYKLSSHTDEPKTEKYIDAYLYTEYKYKVIYDNTTKESIKEIQPKTIYESDESRERNTEDVKIEGSKGVIKTITTYKVDNEGNLIENTLENTEKEVINTIVKVGTKSKVEFLKENNRVVKRTTTYTVNSETGEVVTTSTDKLMSNTDKEPPIEERSILKNIPDDIEKTTISHKVKYIPNYDKEFGYNKVLVEGKDGVTTKTTSYIVDENGNVTSNVKENVTDSVNKEIEIGLKTKTEIITEDGKEIERTTKYELDENTGNISKKIENKILNDSKDKIISTDTPVDDNGNLILPPVVDELTEFNGGVNSIEPSVEEKPEYTGSISINTPIDDKGELITPPVEKKLEYTEPVSTNTPIDENGNLILPPTIEKLEFNGNVNSTEPPIVENPEYKLTEEPKETPVKETLKEESENKIIEQKQDKELPNTNSTSVLATLVSSVIGTLGLGYKSKRKK